MPLNSFLVLRGFVTARPDKSKNEKMATGDIEVLIENLVSVHPKRKKGVCRKHFSIEIVSFSRL